MLHHLAASAFITRPIPAWPHRLVTPRAPKLFCSDAKERLPRIDADNTLERAPRLDAQLAPTVAAAAAAAAGDPLNVERDPLNVERLTKITPYWRQRLRELQRPAAVELVSKLKEENALGFVNQKTSKGGTLVDYAAQEKERHPEKVLLIKVRGAVS